MTGTTERREGGGGGGGGWGGLAAILSHDFSGPEQLSVLLSRALRLFADTGLHV